MNSKGDKHLKTLGDLAKKNNFSLTFLKKQISLDRLKFEKKGSSFYSTQIWLDEYKKNFTFSGFMFDRVFPKENIAVASDVKKKSIKKTEPKKTLGKIIKEERVGVDVGIEEAFVSKWNNEFKKINNQLDDYIKDSSKNKKRKHEDNLVTKSHNMHSAVIAVAILFLLSFYSVSIVPDAANAFTKKIDGVIKAPYSFINQLALKQVMNDDAVLQNEKPSSEQLSRYIKNKINNISYPVGSTVDVDARDIVGRVAGIHEEYNNDTSLFEKVKKTSIEVFTKMSDKQKRASLRLNDKLNGFIASITN